jgi:hypothetical protein
LLRSRCLLGVLQLALSGIKEPNFKRRAGLGAKRFTLAYGGTDRGIRRIACVQGSGRKWSGADAEQKK